MFKKMLMLAALGVSFNASAEVIGGISANIANDVRYATVEYKYKAWYVAADIPANIGDQMFVRGGRYIFDKEVIYLKMGVCITERNEIVSSNIMFNPSVGVRMGDLVFEWSHCSSAGLSDYNYGYDLISVKVRF